MKNNNISVICRLLFVGALVVLPHYTHAYFTTGQTAEVLTPTTALYTVEYAFGLNNQDIYMPVSTLRGINTTNTDKKVGYSLHTGSSTVSTGNSAAIVIANLPIVSGMYKIAKGAAQKMTLIVLYTSTSTMKADYTLQVDKMPFYVDYGNGVIQTRQLNPSELQYYVTPAVSLGQK